MGPRELTFAVLAVAFSVSSADACSSPEDVERKMADCRNTAYYLRQPTECPENAGEELIKLGKCLEGCTNVPAGAEAIWKTVYNNTLQNLGGKCADLSVPPAEARDGGPANQISCDINTIAQIVPCVGSLGALINIPAEANAASLQGVCNILGGLTSAITSCEPILACAASAGSFQQQFTQVQYGINIAKELQNGGCACLGNLTLAVNQFSTLPTNQEALLLVCPLVQSTTFALKTALDTCVNTIGGAVDPSVRNINWLQVTIGMLETINPAVTLVCNVLGILNHAAAIGLGLLTIFGAFLLHSINKLRIYVDL